MPGVEVIAGVVGLLLGAVAGFVFDRLRQGAAYKNRDEIVQQAEREAEQVKKDREIEAKEERLARREEFEKQLAAEREEVRQEEKRLDKRESLLNEQQEDILKKERMLETQQNKVAERQKAVEKKNAELDRVLSEEQDRLYEISGLSKDEATDRLLDRLRTQLANETGSAILEHQRKLKEECDKQAREIIGMALQRYAAQHTSESTTSSVDLPNDEMKGRIIGREGRNIRAFEKSTGVDVIVDDTPGVVIVSAFDTVRRQIARISLEKLIQDGRIHPSRIEEVVAETQQEMDDRIRDYGLEACREANVVNLHERLVYLMGRLQFRTSYSQNVLGHSVEVAYLTGMIAEQFGMDGELARRCGFLHDIGKAADHEMEGGHPAVGAELLKRFGEGEEVVHAAAGHHDDIRVDHIYTVFVAAADAVSASRPGARRETLEKYVKRLEELETLACGFPGVEQAFAVQAGREIRVVVDSGQVNDREAATMCREMAQAIEQSLTYPGEIKVTVLRESRAVEFAR